MRNIKTLNYIAKEKLEVDKSVLCSYSDIDYSFVIPVYNEESNIVSTVKSIAQSSKYSNIKAEIVIGNNMSTDNTVALISEIASDLKSSIPISTVNIVQPGCGPTRKRIMDQVLVQHYSKRHVSINKYMIMLDGDSTVTVDFLKVLDEKIKKTGATILTNVYKYPKWIDIEISKHTNIENYLGRAGDMLIFLSRRGCASLRTNGVNTAIQIDTYARLGGIDLVSNFHSTDTALGEKARSEGINVEYHDTVSITSPRRYFEATFRDCKIDDTFDCLRICTRSDRQLFTKFVNLMDKRNSWTAKRIENEVYLFKRYCLLPIVVGELDIDNFIELISKSLPTILKNKIINQIKTLQKKYQKHNNRETIANCISDININEVLNAIYLYYNI